MILDQLKSRTAANHASFERRLHITRAEPTLADYGSYLSAMYGFTAPLEVGFQRLPLALTEELELGMRLKAGLLAQDLACLDVRLGRVVSADVCEQLPANDSPARTLGTLYVLEGSTLGARYLLRHLQPLGIEDCSSYLRSYGDSLGPMWEKMRAVLVRHAEVHPEQQPDLVDAALQTFETLDAWFVRCGAAEASHVS
jgi:heme oxygenase